ncbi:MAG: MarR family winged helix-turn-helix transcriptional regulator [Faecousia sp.]
MDWKKQDMEMSVHEQLRVLLIRCGQKLGSGHGKHQTQGRILKILYYHGPMTQKMLQDKLDIQPGSMSEIAAKLEHKGLLCREKDPVDKRQILLTLTEAGRADVEQFHKQRKSQHTKDFDVLTQEEQQQLLHQLEKLLDSWSSAQELAP